MDPFDRDMSRSLSAAMEAERQIQRWREQYAFIDENSTFAQLAREAALWEAQRRRVETLMGPAGYADQLAGIARAAEEARGRWGQLGAIAESTRRITADYDRWWQEMQPTIVRLREVGALEQRLASTAFSSLEDSLRRTAELANVWGGLDQAGVTALMLGPAEGFGRYSRSAIRRIAAAESDDQRTIPDMGLALAATALDAVNTLHEEVAEEGRAFAGDGVRIIIERPIDSARVIQIGIRVEAFFQAQEEQLLEQVPVLIGEHGEPLTSVPSSRRTARQVEFGMRVAGCLKEARIRQRELPFDLGETVLGFFAELGVIEGSTDEGLGRFVDGLYFTLYEATAKKRKLRQYLPENRLTIVDRVQRIRNRLFRHAFEQEQAIAIAHQGPEIVTDLEVLGVRAIPQTPGERLVLHDALLDGSLSLLGELLEAIRA